MHPSFQVCEYEVMRINISVYKHVNLRVCEYEVMGIKHKSSHVFEFTGI